MTVFQVLFYTISGIFLAGLYLLLLWLTLLALPKVTSKGIFLLCSFVLRLALFVMISLYISQTSIGAFLLIVISFLITRFIVVKCMIFGEKK